MLGVVENYILEDHILPEIILTVALALKTTGIIDFRVWLRGTLSRDEIDHGDLAILPLTFEVVEKAWLVVAFNASNLTMF